MGHYWIIQETFMFVYCTASYKPDVCGFVITCRFFKANLEILVNRARNVLNHYLIIT
jgi:hypothetical protein